jgi:ssDNA-binding Zn-finger/Zn-ribbon topoisomerase 1
MENKTVVLIIDEAQKLDETALEILRICLNYETNKFKFRGENRKFYGCSNFPRCKETHGANQITGEPLGKPALKEVKVYWDIVFSVGSPSLLRETYLMPYLKFYSVSSSLRALLKDP